MTQRKGIILAGGAGTRLSPITLAVSKHLLPVYDKPMIYYPLSVLMLAGIREILIIINQEHIIQFENLLGDGSQWGLNISYKIQPSPDGIAQAYIISEEFLQGEPSAMILGDNIFYGQGLTNLLAKSQKHVSGATIFGYHVSNPSQYGVIEFNEDRSVHRLLEKPRLPKTNFALTGLYFLDGSAPSKAKLVKPSERGELEIISVLNSYLGEGTLRVEQLGRGYSWLDAGTHSSLLEASTFVRTVTERQGLHVGSPDEVSYRFGWITRRDFINRCKHFKNSEYGKFLKKLV